MAVLILTDDKHAEFKCPGCNSLHSITVNCENSWEWNGDLEKPTIKPSILVVGTHLTSRGETDYNNWVDAGFPNRNVKIFESVETRCHSFITDGMIQFLSDCSHNLAGQTVPLPIIN